MDASLTAISRLIGNTGMHKLNLPFCLYAKLEFQNLFGSIKDRPALFILQRALEKGLIDQDTIIIESTSGNFGLALAGICRSMGIRFISVIDPNISRQKEQLLRLISYKVIKVTEKDETGGYLLSRIRTVKEFMAKTANSFNPNQYENHDNYLSYYYTLGSEICTSLDRLDYVFVSVSSCGTLIGLSRRLKEKFPSVRIVAVDIEGSMIFSDKIKTRKISGIGASMRSPLLDLAVFDDVLILSQEEIAEGCHELLMEQSLFLGPSSGAAYVGAKRILQSQAEPESVSLFIAPDHGVSYLDNVYSKEWLDKNVINIKEKHEVFE